MPDHSNILGDVDALHVPELGTVAEYHELARRIGFAKVQILEALGNLSQPYLAERALFRGLRMLQTGKAE